MFNHFASGGVPDASAFSCQLGRYLFNQFDRKRDRCRYGCQGAAAFFRATRV
jgi:hypothetical protein